MPEKNLKSATAISTIIHPNNPHVPSIHIHISLTQLRDNTSYWRIMADLNPSIYNQEDKKTFDRTLQKLDPNTYDEATLQGDKYFNIPVLERHRGVSHYYLENYNTHNKQKDYDFALNFGAGVIDSYIEIIDNALRTRKTYTKEEMQKQLAYHTLYLFQVLTLDRGTTSGLLVHDQNDLGIMGSLPSYINKELLNSWMSKVAQPQDELIKEIAHVINASGAIDADTKARLADVVRKHYRKYPKALEMQASGNTVPNTVDNHAKP
jgi:coproporphyrinogen III oxidase